MAHPLRASAAIIGYGDSYVNKGQPLKSPMRLAAEATMKAVADAGISKDDIDGVLTGRAPLADQRPQWNNVFCASMKLVPQFSTEVTIHGAGVNAMLKYAMMAIESKVCRFVLCVQSDAVGLVDPKKMVPDLDADPEFERPYGPMITSLYGQIAYRMMHEYGITEEHMATVAVQCQNWALHHPNAHKRDLGPFTVEQINATRPMSSPLRLGHMSTWGPPGTAGALIVTSAETARTLSRQPIYLLGAGECVTHEYLTDRLNLRQARVDLGTLPNLTTTGALVAGKLAYEMAGIGPEDVDIVQTGSNFAHIEMMMLAELGFCDKREVGDFVMSGAPDIGGTLPTNTNGGWLSFGSSGIACIMDSTIEGVRQLRGEALGVQVEAPEVALLHGTGGVASCHSVTILSTAV